MIAIDFGDTQDNGGEVGLQEFFDGGGEFFAQGGELGGFLGGEIGEFGGFDGDGGEFVDLVTECR